MSKHGDEVFQDAPTASAAERCACECGNKTRMRVLALADSDRGTAENVGSDRGMLRETPLARGHWPAVGYSPGL